jgi:hypothetical protein
MTDQLSCLTAQLWLGKTDLPDEQLVYSSLLDKKKLRPFMSKIDLLDDRAGRALFLGLALPGWNPPVLALSCSFLGLKFHAFAFTFPRS